MVGAHNVLNALLGIAACRELNVSYEDMIKGLDNLEATSMRLQFINKDKFTIINDCYNASPDSMKAALDVLGNTKGKRKIAILGNMNELGNESEKAHKEVGEYATDLRNVIKEGDAIIIKASRGVKFEEIVKALENLDI